LSKCGGKIDGSGGLPHSALLISNGQDGGHKKSRQCRDKIPPWVAASPTTILL
jgi:hypothetical protein